MTPAPAEAVKSIKNAAVKINSNIIIKITHTPTRALL
jgi:hypothetical protein